MFRRVKNVRALLNHTFPSFPFFIAMRLWLSAADYFRQKSFIHAGRAETFSPFLSHFCSRGEKLLCFIRIFPLYSTSTHYFAYLKVLLFFMISKNFCILPSSRHTFVRHTGCDEGGEFSVLARLSFLLAFLWLQSFTDNFHTELAPRGCFMFERFWWNWLKKIVVVVDCFIGVVSRVVYQYITINRVGFKVANSHENLLSVATQQKVNELSIFEFLSRMVALPSARRNSTRAHCTFNSSSSSFSPHVARTVFSPPLLCAEFICWEFI